MCSPSKIMCHERPSLTPRASKEGPQQTRYQCLHYMLCSRGSGKRVALQLFEPLRPAGLLWSASLDCYVTGFVYQLPANWASSTDPLLGAEPVRSERFAALDAMCDWQGLCDVFCLTHSRFPLTSQDALFVSCCGPR
ncbi:hypothetical protein TRVL_09298 [Trypanosoma vivax]|nr:hypothetical protein TRVL_09298 [Trypanosoma vivax]